MRIEFWVRAYQGENPPYAQDHVGLIILARNTIMYSRDYNLWFRVTERPSIDALKRPGCIFFRVTYSHACVLARRKLWWLLFLDFLNIAPKFPCNEENEARWQAEAQPLTMFIET